MADDGRVALETRRRGGGTTEQGELMSVHVRPASLQDGVAVLELLEQVGYYPEPISFAKTYRKTLTDPHFLVRVALAEDGKIVGMASLSMRWQRGRGASRRRESRGVGESSISGGQLTPHPVGVSSPLEPPVAHRRCAALSSL